MIDTRCQVCGLKKQQLSLSMLESFTDNIWGGSIS
jgi:hypothetical protein